MSAGAWTAVGALIAVVGVTITALGAWFTARAGRKVSPYDALADRVTYLEQQHTLDRETLDRQHDEIKTLRQERADDQTEIAGLQRRVVGIIDDRDALVRYIIVLQAWVASGARPPAPPVPSHLAEVIPAWVPGDGVEPPPRVRTDGH